MSGEEGEKREKLPGGQGREGRREDESGGTQAGELVPQPRISQTITTKIVSAAFTSLSPAATLTHGLSGAGQVWEGGRELGERREVRGGDWEEVS